MVRKKAELVLPQTIVSPVDLAQVIRELQVADDTLLQGATRKGGEDTKLPQAGRLLTDLAEVNQLNLLHAEDRQELLTWLTGLQDDAPVLHMSFNADPSPVFMSKLTAWVREQLHPHALIRTGLLPAIGAGCVLRTTNQVFDFSLKNQFDQNRHLLMDKIRAGAKGAA